MKLLYVTTIAETMVFFKEHFNMLLAEGNVIELACNCNGRLPACCEDLGLVVHHIPFSRNPFSSSNIDAYRKLKSLLKENRYDIVHTHTPNASVFVRLACRKMRANGLKVFYTAHGFHFYKGAPLRNWLMYYPIEWICAHWTNVLITINQEDYLFARKHMHAKKVVYVPGVGIDLSKFENVIVDRNEKRKELGIPENATLLLSVGELNQNKNHETVIKAIAGMDVYYIIAGSGNKQEGLQLLIDEVGMNGRIKLLGYRTDVYELYKASDIFIFPSFREGLSVSVMEAMASGLPCVVSRIRGNTDLVDEDGGELFDPHDVKQVKSMIENVLNGKKQYGEYNRNKIRAFSTNVVLEYMKTIYAD